MKKTLTIAAIALLGLASCKKCVTCKTFITTDASGTVYDSYSESSSEVCGTSKEIDAVEGTTTSYATQGGVTVTTIQETKCQ